MKKSLKNIKFQKCFSQPIKLEKDDKSFAFFVFHNFASLEAKHSIFDASPGNVFLRSPGLELKVKTQGNYSLSYSILEFKGSVSSKIIKISNIEENVLLKPLQIHYSDSILSKISLELSSNGINWESIVYAHIHELLGKTVRLCNHDFTETLPDHSQRLRDLRSEIHESFSKPWKIDDMAAKMKLSTSRFASLYKSVFKISPTEDLIQTRIDQAKKMLSASKVSVKKVSDACGFESVHYFHRAFKKRANITPKHFQNSQFADSGSVYSPERHFSLDRLTQLAEYSGIIEFIDGNLKFHGNANHVADLLGYPESEIRDRSFMDFVASEDHEIAKDGSSKILNGKNILDLNIKILHRSGEKIPVQFSALLKGKNWYWFIKHSAVVVAKA